MSTQVANEKWILTVKELHLGHCKETFRAGAVIELDEANGRLIIDGRRFNDTRDLDVLKRQAERYPDNPWVIPYSPEARKEVLSAVAPQAISQHKQLHPDQNMKVVQSDEDLQEEIDISSTKVSQVNAAAKQAAKDKVRTKGMEIIRGDETVEERLANLKGKTDMGSIAERARLKASGAVKMAVVRDDSLGAGFGGKNHVSMNAGQHLPSREEADAHKGDATALAESRKKEAEIRRNAQESAGESVNADIQAPAVESSTGAPTPFPEAPSVAEAQLAEENFKLKADNAALVERMDRLEKMMTAQVGATPKRGRKPAQE